MEKKKYIPSACGFREMRQKYGLRRDELAEFFDVPEEDIAELEEKEIATDTLRKKIIGLLEGNTRDPKAAIFWREKCKQYRICCLYMLMHIQKAINVGHFNMSSASDEYGFWKFQYESATQSAKMDAIMKALEEEQNSK